MTIHPQLSRDGGRVSRGKFHLSGCLRRFADAWLSLCTALHMIVMPGAARAQYYEGDPYLETEGPSVMERLLTSPAVSLLIVLLGSAGLFNLFFSSGKGERSDKQSLIAIVCFLIVVLMVWYRFSLWSDKKP